MRDLRRRNNNQRRGDQDRQVGGGEILHVRRPVCFFFQVEDGIRDVAVTGVQTCALPICWNRSSRRRFLSARLSYRRRTPRPHDVRRAKRIATVQRRSSKSSDVRCSWCPLAARATAEQFVVVLLLDR